MSIIPIIVGITAGAIVYFLWYLLGLNESSKILQSIPIDDVLPLVEIILDEWKQAMGEAYQGYRGHCYRVFHFTKALYPGTLNATQLEQVAIAVAHHDIGIWSDPLANGKGNIDYIDPSVARAVDWLKKNKKPNSWIEPITLLISEHHKLTSYNNPLPNGSLIESFRRADLVDFSLGLVRHGLSKSLVSQVRTYWKNEGFHAGLIKIALARLKTHPFNPVPMMKIILRRDRALISFGFKHELMEEDFILNQRVQAKNIRIITRMERKKKEREAKSLLTGEYYPSDSDEDGSGSDENDY